MCGIVGLFAKTPGMQATLGEHLSGMLIEMTDRGPDSAGVAIYRNPAPAGASKLTVHAAEAGYSWAGLAKDMAAELSDDANFEVRASHAIITVHGSVDVVRAWLKARYPDLRVVSAGSTIEIFKEVGLPKDVVERFGLRELAGSHALGHTRMATESAVTTAHCHPFSAGLDVCLVHNGSLSNHNSVRRRLAREGIAFQTDNDSEVAAGYLAWRMEQGASLDEALDAAIKELDGFYTFAVGTRTGFAVLRDPIACKHAVLAETDDWVAMATEYRAIAGLPGADRATIWEPTPGRIYSWGAV